MSGITVWSDSYHPIGSDIMELVYQDPQSLNLLKNELKLQINQRLFEQGLISREVYEQAKIKLVSSAT